MKACFVPLIAALLIFATVLPGCGGGGVPVVVKVVNGDQPYSKEKDGDIGLTLSTADGNGPTFTGKVNPDGTFKMVGPESDGVQPGKFTASVTMYASAGDSSKGPPTPVTKSLPGTVEITSATKEVVIDLAKLQ